MLSEGVSGICTTNTWKFCANHRLERGLERFVEFLDDTLIKFTK